MVIGADPNTRFRDVFCILLAAAGFLVQGIYILATGFLSPAGDRRPVSARPMRLLARLWAGSIPLCAGMLAGLLLVAAAAHRQAPTLPATGWLRAHAGSLVGPLVGAGFAIWFIIAPAKMVKWIEDSQQVSFNRKERRWAFRILRFVSVWVLGMAVFMLAMVLAAPPHVP
jgi:hypothetical protein